ncbi:MAG: PA14 domain-containing protein [Actinomycetota bacterium]
MTGPDGVMWKYVGDGAGGTSGRLATVNNGIRDVLKITYDGSGRPQKIQNANDLNPGAASPGYDGTHAITIGYDTASPARVQTVTEGPVTGQTPATATWTLAYNGAASTDPTANHGGARPADGYTTLTAPGASASSKVYFDHLGRTMESVDELLHATQVAYNDHDQLLWSEDADGNPTDNVYDAVNDVLLTTTGPDPDGGGPLTRPVTSYRYDETATGTTGTPGPAMQGLQASYYDNKNLAGRPTARKTDSTVNFDWVAGKPAELTGDSDTFSVRWSGNVDIPTTGDYTFTLEADDGVRLTIDTGSAMVAVIDSWVDGAITRVSPAVNLAAGLHKITLDYYENTGNAKVKLRWECATCSIDEQVIPASALRPGWMNQTSVVDPSGVVAFHHFNDPAAGKADYDLIKVGGVNHITAYEYEAQPSLGRLTRKFLPKGNASRSIDSSGNLQGSGDTAYSTTWTYYGMTETAAPPAACGVGPAVTQAGLLKSLQHAGIAATTTVYDTAGRAIASTNGAGSSCSTYDSEGRLTGDKAPGETGNTTYTYDPAGAQRTATDPASVVVTSEYDEAGRVKRSIDSFGAESVFAYNGEGQMLSRTSAIGSLAGNPNYTTTNSYNDAGQLTQIQDPAGRLYKFTYETRGNLHTIQYPNATFAWFDYNAGGSLSALFNRHGTLSVPPPPNVPADASPIVDYAYTYNILAKKTQEVRTGGGLTTETQSYAYDEIGRMKSVTLPNLTLREYSFDLDSNRTKIEETPSGGVKTTVATYAYSPTVLDQLASVTQGSTTNYGYNTDGDTTSRGSDAITWDGRGRTTGGTFSGTTVTYNFDPAGRRSQRVAGAGPNNTLRYLFGGGDASVFETNGNGTLQRTSIAGPAGDLASYAGAPTTGTTVSYLLFNGHGDVAAEADNAGTRTAAYTYDPFGGALQAPPSNTTVERWTGKWDKQLDTASGLIQMGARPYDPALGRFLAVDPLVGGMLNNYVFALDPVNDYDLDGRGGWHCDYSAGSNSRRCKAETRKYRAYMRRRGTNLHLSFGLGGCFGMCFGISFSGGRLYKKVGFWGWGMFGPSISFSSARAKDQDDWSFGGCAAYRYGGCISRGRRKSGSHFWSVTITNGYGFSFGPEHSSKWR